VWADVAGTATSIDGGDGEHLIADLAQIVESKPLNQSSS
jgi:hypothetical protein